MKIAIVRGAFLNPWEGQNFEPLLKRHEVVVFGAKKILGRPGKIPVCHLWSPTDLPNFPKKMPVLNRMMVDAHYLLGLEKKLSGFDIAHCAETYYHYTQQCLKAKSNGLVKKVVSTCWEVIPFNNEGIWGRKKFKQRAIKEVDLFITPTEKAKQVLIKEGCNPNKIRVIRVGIDLSRFKYQKLNIKMISRNSKNLKILFVGRLVEEKGVWELLEAFRRLITDLKKSWKLKLILIGSGKEKKKFLSWIDRVSMYRYIDTKVVGYSEMAEEYWQADIFVLPSKPTKYSEEQYGMVLIEAMATGLPIVTTKCGAIPEVVGKAAILIDPGRVDQLYSSLKLLVESEEKRWFLGKEARARAEKEFDCRKTAAELERAYQNLSIRS